MLDQTLAIDSLFPESTLAHWEKMTKTVLKTDDLNNKLMFRSIEGFDLYPLNTKSDWCCELSTYPSKVLITSSNILKDETTIDLTKIHNAGASIIQEVYYACIEFIKLIETNTKEITVHISTDSLYFSNIAKVRALRYLFEELAQESNSNHNFIIVAHNSLREQTLFDPWVNMLRSTTSSMAAILGGADKVSSYSYDFLFSKYSNGKTSSLGSRNAENELKILLEESHLDRVNDPMKGSHSIEAATLEIITKSWNLIKENNDTFNLETFSKEVQKTASKRYELAQKRKITITGINNFANPDDSFQNLFNSNIDLNKVIGDDLFPLRTVAFEFESIRSEFNRENNPVKILVLEPESKISARINFCRNYFEVIGANVSEVKALEDVTENDHVIICASDDTYTNDLTAIINSLKTINTKSTYLAGNFDISNFPQITNNLFMGQNIFEVLKHFTKELS
jgi:hypothetical protein